MLFKRRKMCLCFMRILLISLYISMFYFMIEMYLMNKLFQVCVYVLKNLNQRFYKKRLLRLNSMKYYRFNINIRKNVWMKRIMMMVLMVMMLEEVNLNIKEKMVKMMKKQRFIRMMEIIVMKIMMMVLIVIELVKRERLFQMKR